MIEFTSGQLTGWVMHLFWPFVRILAFVAAAPIFGQSGVSRLAKIGTSLALALIIAPTVENIPDIAPVSYAGVWLIVQQILIGSAIGLVMQVVFAAIQSAGVYVGLQMGLGFASFYSSVFGGNVMVLGQILNMFALLFFLAVDGHLFMLRILAGTFDTLPIGTGGLNAAGWELAAQWGSTVFTAGLGLALPLVAALLTMGILNRASPQLSIFSVGFPMTLIAGLVVLTFMTPELGGVFAALFERGLAAMQTLIQAFASAPAGSS